MWNRIAMWFRRLFGGPRKTDKEETKKVLALREKYKKWGKEDQND